jgi:hypothetical protein
MMRRVLSTVFLTALVLTPRVRADDLKDEINGDADPTLLDSRFTRYGFAKEKSIVAEEQGFRFKLPAREEGVEQTGVYSRVVLAGDFEVSAGFDLIAVAPPEKGYGMTCGIGIDCQIPRLGKVQFMRGYQMGKVNAFIIAQYKLTENGMAWDNKTFPAVADKGTLRLRREKDELIFLAGDGERREPDEIYRITFPKATIEKVRFFADSGGSPTELDARINHIRVAAEQITARTPDRDLPTNYFWWIATPALFALAGGGYLVYRRRRSES